MASTCRLGYAPSPEDDNADSGNPIHAQTCDVDSTPDTAEKLQPTRFQIDIEQLSRHLDGRSERALCPRLKLKVLLLLFLACATCSSIYLRSFPCRTYIDVAETRLLSHSQNAKLAVDEIFLSRAKLSSSAVLEVFQVHQPVLVPSGRTERPLESSMLSDKKSAGSAKASESCTQLLMKHSFGFSYGHPFVGNYTPPSCQFNRVVMNFTVTSRGRQFDRLALMYFGDTEVWRTSTAEPTTDGIRWVHLKDMSKYLYFWNRPQKIIFDLGNLIDSKYTGFFNTTLTATFFMDPDGNNAAPLIIPISARKSPSDAASLFMLPADIATNTIDFPQNANRAVFSVSACGQAAEEFWWSNVFQSNIDTFRPNDGVLPGFSPWREIQIYIDGQLAGVEWPFPIIFTGGVAPGLWRPIVGIDAFDLREHEIDITPWLPILCDGNQHTFEIKVAGIDDDGHAEGALLETVGNSWYVTGKIFVWLDGPKSITTGTRPTVILPQPHITLFSSYTQNATGSNQTLSYSMAVTRSLSVSSMVKTQESTTTETWSQSLSYLNHGSFTDQGNSQTNDFRTFGYDVSTGANPYTSSYKYPLYANTTVIVDMSGNFSISANLDFGLDLKINGNSIYPSGLELLNSHSRTASDRSTNSGTHLHTSQSGTAYYFASPSTGTGMSFGSTKQKFVFVAVNPGSADELYTRDVAAVNGTVVRDKETLLSVTTVDYVGPDPPIKGMGPQGAAMNPKQAIGRGPGQSKPALAQGGV